MPKSNDHPPKKPIVIATRKLPDAIETRLSELYKAELWPHERPMNGEELDAALARAEVLVCTLTEHLHAQRLASAGDQLKLIANFGAGVDHIDLATARARGIIVTNSIGASAEDVADIAMGLVIALPRRFKEGVNLAASSAWEGWSPTALMGHRLRGLSLGILGMGRTGQALAARAAAFGLDIHYHSNREATGVENMRFWPSFDQMLANVDILSIHVPGTPATYHLLNQRRIALMKPTAYVINTARGHVVDENALTRALREGRLAGAGLDVHSGGHVINPRLQGLENVIVLPHMASATFEGRHEMGERVLLNIQTFINGHRSPDMVFI